LWVADGAHLKSIIAKPLRAPFAGLRQIDDGFRYCLAGWINYPRQYTAWMAVSLRP
jgi:hypothetical protein